MKKPELSRRHFLLGAAALGVSAPVAWHFWRQDIESPREDHEFFSSYGEWTSVDVDQIDPPKKSYVVFYQPRSLRMQHFLVPFRIHSGVQDPTRKNYLVFIPKWGQTLCSFDRNTGEVLKTIACAKGRRFFGHGVWDVTSNGFWVTENDDGINEGRLVLRNHELEIIREIPTYGTYPHEVKLAKGAPGVLQVCNTGDFKTRCGTMSWISIADGKLVKQLKFEKEIKDAGPTHFMYSRRAPDSLFIGSLTSDVTTPSHVWRVRGDNAPARIEAQNPELFRGEVVSWAESPSSGLMMWTQAKTKSVFSFDVDNGVKADVRMSVYPHGMVADGNIVWVTKKSKLLRWEKGFFKEVARGPWLGEARFGSHIVRIES